MKAFILGIFALCLWAIPVRYYYVCKIKKHCDNPVVQPTQIEERLLTLRLTAGDSVIVQGREQFSFASDSTQANLSNDNEQFLHYVASILLSDSTQQVVLTGYYRPNELQLKPDFFDNIGLARANVIKKMINGHGVKDEQIRLQSAQSSSNQLKNPIGFDLKSLTELSQEEEEAK